MPKKCVPTVAVFILDYRENYGILKKTFAMRIKKREKEKYMNFERGYYIKNVIKYLGIEDLCGHLIE